VGRLMAETEASGFRENSWSRPIGEGPGLRDASPGGRADWDRL